MKEISCVTRRLTAMAISTCMVFGSASAAFAADTRTIGDSPESVTIPVTASIDSYYVIGVPASAGLTLTKEHNDMLITANSGVKSDTNSTFYGQCNVKAKGVLPAGKTLKATLTISDLEDGNSHSAPVGLSALSHSMNDNMDKIWASDPGAARQTFSESDWANGTSGITVNYSRENLNTADWYTNCVMLRTTLPVDGTYTSNLDIRFSVE